MRTTEDKYEKTVSFIRDIPGGVRCECPHCLNEINITKSVLVCPYCNEEIVYPAYASW